MSAWARHAGASLLLAVVAAAPAVAQDGTVRADSSLTGKPIGSIDLIIREIFEPLPEGPFQPVFRAANAVHVRSRGPTVRSHLLFEAGDPWDPEVARETARNMRALEFVQPEAITAVAAGGGDSVAVRVETRDTWSTLVEFNLEGGGGDGFGAVSFSERNFLGYGTEVELFYSESPGGSSRGVAYRDPALFYSRARLNVGLSRGSAGIRNTYYVGVPWYALDAPYTMNSRGTRSTSVARLYELGEEVATFDRREEDLSVTWGRGVHHDGRVLRLETSFFLMNRRYGPTQLEPGAPPGFAGDEENLRIRRFSIRGTAWRPKYIERRFVNSMGPIEDFEVGMNASAELGWSPLPLGGSADEGYIALEGAIGRSRADGFGWLRARMESRMRSKPEEVMGSVNFRWVSQRVPSHTLVLSVLGIGGVRAARDFQVIFGGLNGLRAYPVQAIAGKQGWRFNAEDRIPIAISPTRLVRFGLAVFYDAARTWGDGAGQAGWYQAAGAGLRISLPRLSPSQVLRVDVAWPIAPSIDGHRDPVLTFGSRQAF